MSRERGRNSAGAVGYVPYISLASGTYALAYRVPLTSTVCALTPLETTIAACAVTNATYGQTGSNAIVSALTVNTARIWVGLGGTSSTSDYVGNSNARTTYAYAPSSQVTSNADQWYGCTKLKTTVSGAGVTAGSILAGGGFLTASYGAATTVSAATGPTIGAAAVGSLNLAGEARVDVVYLHTTGADGAAPVLQDLTFTVLN
jgi:hypothetical protein